MHKMAIYEQSKWTYSEFLLPVSHHISQSPCDLWNSFSCILPSTPTKCSMRIYYKTQAQSSCTGSRLTLIVRTADTRAFSSSSSSLHKYVIFRIPRGKLILYVACVITRFCHQPVVCRLLLESKG